jgi:hypothetical protein
LLSAFLAAQKAAAALQWVRVSRDREHGFHCIVSKYFAGS